MIEFASPAIEAEWNDARTSAEAKSVVVDLDAHMEALGHPGVVVTDVGRDEAWYARNNLPVNPNSLHYLFDAIDIRIKHWKDGARSEAQRFILRRCQPRENYELVFRDHGTGPHYHIGVRREPRTSSNA